MDRPSGRKPNQLRDVEMTLGVSKHAEGSCLVKFGDTHVLCLATVETKTPPWMKNSGRGWVTAEYGMLPRSTNERMDREAARGKQSGRTQEIQRLIGRSLRSVVKLEAMGECQVRVDCDVIQADGGTRTAAITGGFAAMHQAFSHMLTVGMIKEIPITDTVAAISCGIFEGQSVLDLDYAEDSNAETDANFVITGKGALVEIQCTAEKDPFSEEQFMGLLRLAQGGCAELSEMQRKVLGI
ncbi:MAG: ribonuclease PH [Alphaproteobacteria bacterium]|nr:ribonuclease PH [Alphaproteobacteria bacterium]QQS56759.1 MAG: ribonuclease PH [Alphaproteobacteria bacterium]